MLFIKFGMIIEGFTWDALIKFLYNLEEPLFMAGVSSSEDWHRDGGSCVLKSFSSFNNAIIHKEKKP